jgi:propanol-preferring alcohol dehydrogenase
MARIRCGTCGYCTTGWETLCEQQRNTGYSVDGGYAEYAAATAKYVA